MTDGGVMVVVATYNGASVIEEQLTSILEQTAPPLEVIVGDDGSTDGTADIAEAISARSRVPMQVVRNAARLGYVENFLELVGRARGDFVAYSDQDDVWLPDKLARCCQPLQDAGVTAVVHGYRLVDQHLEPLDRGLHTGLLRRLMHEDLLFVPHGSQMVFRSALRQLVPPQGRPVSTYGGHAQEHDEWAYFAARAVGRVAFIRDRLILYRRHEGAASYAQASGRRQGWLDGIPADRPAARRIAAPARRDYLLECAERVTGDGEVALRVAAGSYDRLTHNLLRRQEQDDGSAPERWRALWGALVHGAYRRCGTGGLGSLALLHDLRAAVSASRARFDRPRRG